VFPSDTSYGIAGDTANNQVLNKIYEIKNRPADKYISYIFKDVEQIEKYANVSSEQRDILSKNLPRSFTIVLENRNVILPDQKTIGVRIPDYKFTKLLSSCLDIPYTSTSANISGMPSCYKIEDFLKQIENQTALPDLIIDAGELPNNKPSTVVNIVDTKNILVKRKGSAVLRV